MAFRSPLLQSYPSQRDAQQLRILRRRALGILFVLLLFGIPALLVWSRIPPADGWGHGLYWMHDHVFLPLKGHVYTRFLPFSMLFWVLMGALALAWLYFFANRQSLVRPMHIWLLKIVLKVPSTHGLLLSCARALAQRGFGAHLMIEVADYQRTCLLDNAPEADTNQGNALALARITLLQLRLLQLPGGEPEHPLKAALAFEESFLTLREHLPKDDRGLLVALANEATYFCAPLAGEDNLNILVTRASDHVMFTPQAFAIDLLHLALLGEPKLAKHIPGAPGPERPPVERENFVASRLALTAKLRRGVLDGLRRFLEERHLRFRESPSGAWPGAQLAELAAAQLALWGKLTLGFVLDRATLEAHPQALLTYIESMEATRLALALSPAECSDEEAETCTAFSQLLGRLPLRRHYQRCGALAQSMLDARKDAWRESNLERLGYVVAADFITQEDRVWGFAQAAGPDLVPGEGEI